MRVSSRRLVVGIAVAAAITGCAPRESTTTQQSSSGGAPSRQPGPGASVTSTTEDKATNTKHTVLKSGLGGDDRYVWAAALLRNDSPKSGATVVANFNLVDAASQIIKSESQTESFSYPGQELAIGTQISLPDGATKPAKVDVTVNVEYPGIGPRTASQPLTFAPAQIVKDQYGDS